MHRKKILNKMDCILIILGILIALYTIAVLGMAWCGKYVPDSLTYCLLGTSTAEGIIMGAIKNTNTKYGGNNADDKEADGVDESADRYE